jgi:hypothetical protein
MSPSARKKHVARMRENCGNIRRDEKFVLAQTYDGRRAGAGSDDLIGVFGRQDRNGINACKLAHGLSHGVLKRAAIFHVSLDEVSDNFCIGFGDELVAFFFEFALQVHIIFNNPVVDDDDIPRAVAVRMRVFFRRPAMRGPARVPNAIGSVDGRLANHFFQVVQLAGSAANLYLSLCVHDGDARGVIPSVFEAAKSIQNQGNNFFRADVSDDSTHRFISAGLAGRQTRRPA